MKRYFWRMLFVILIVINIIFVAFPIVALYTGSGEVQSNALSLILGSGWLIGALNILVFGYYLIKRRPEGIRLVASVFAIVVSLYYVLTVLV